jgi:hypothetical protein
MNRLGILVASLALTSVSGCEARGADGRDIFMRRPECSSLKMSMPTDASLPRAIRVDFAWESARHNAQDDDWKPSLGTGLDQAWVAAALGLKPGSSGTKIVVRFADAVPCARNGLSAQSGVIRGCRTDACSIEARVTGSRIGSMVVNVPARPTAGPDDLTLRQGRCVVAAVGVAAGIPDLWRADLADAVDLGPGHDPSQGIHRWQVGLGSQTFRCLRAISLETADDAPRGHIR